MIVVIGGGGNRPGSRNKAIDAEIDGPGLWYCCEGNVLTGNKAIDAEIDRPAPRGNVNGGSPGVCRSNH